MTAQNPFDPITILDGIRSWIEIEAPTEAPEPRARLPYRLCQTLR